MRYWLIGLAVFSAALAYGLSVYYYGDEIREWLAANRGAVHTVIYILIYSKLCDIHRVLRLKK